MVQESSTVTTENRIKTFRWLFYISLLQLLAFFIVPALIFPNRLVLHIEIVSALTLGLAVGLFFLLVNVCGFYIDKSRRPLHLAMIIFVGLWFLWATISWLYIERMDYLLG